MNKKRGYTVTGNKIDYVKMSYEKGRSYFMSLGYNPCINKWFLRKNKSYVHFNIVNRYWIVHSK